MKIKIIGPDGFALSNQTLSLRTQTLNQRHTFNATTDDNGYMVINPPDHRQRHFHSTPTMVLKNRTPLQDGAILQIAQIKQPKSCLSKKRPTISHLTLPSIATPMDSTNLLSTNVLAASEALLSLKRAKRVDFKH